MRRPAIVVLALLAPGIGLGCTQSSARPDQDGGPGGDGGDGIGPDGGVGADASVTAGLVLVFEADPSLPDNAGGTFNTVLETAWIELRNVRAVGDSSTGGDTTLPFLRLQFDGEGEGGDDGSDDGSDDGADAGEEDEEDEFPVYFERAPPGIYSHVLADAVSYQLTGIVTVDDDVPSPFDIIDTPPTPISISVNLDSFQLDPNTMGTIALDVDLRDPARAPSWDLVTPDGAGVRRVDGTSPEIASVRIEIGGAFSVDADDDD